MQKIEKLNKLKLDVKKKTKSTRGSCFFDNAISKSTLATLGPRMAEIWALKGDEKIDAAGHFKLNFGAFKPRISAILGLSLPETNLNLTFSELHGLDEKLLTAYFLRGT